MSQKKRKKKKPVAQTAPQNKPKAKPKLKKEGNTWVEWNKSLLLSLLIITGVTLFTYVGALDNDFVDWDDYAYVIDNNLVRSQNDMGSLTQYGRKSDVILDTISSLLAVDTPFFDVCNPASSRPLLALSLPMFIARVALETSR